MSRRRLGRPEMGEVDRPRRPTDSTSSAITNNTFLTMATCCELNSRPMGAACCILLLSTLKRRLQIEMRKFESCRPSQISVFTDLAISPIFARVAVKAVAANKWLAGVGDHVAIHPYGRSAR